MIDSKGMWIWNLDRCEGGDPGKIVKAAQAAGLGHVIIKIADGVYEFNREISRVVKALQAAGITVWGWQYIYGYNVEREARVAVERIKETGVTGFVVNAEVEYKRPGMATNARAYMAGLRAGLGNLFPLALSTYRYPKRHPEFPYQEFLSRCDVAMPQVYWLEAHNPGAQLRESLRQYQEITALPVIPTGAAWRHGKWEATPADVLEFLRTAEQLELGAVNFWSWEHARVIGAWDVIASYGYPGTPVVVPPQDTEQIRVKIKAARLNVRSAPYVSKETARFMAVQGQMFEVERIQGDWVQIKAWVHKDYLEVM